MLFGLLILAGLFFVVLLAAARPAANWLKGEVEKSVAEACDPCQLLIGELSLGISPPRVVAKHITFEQGDPRDSAVSAEAEELVMPIPWSNLGGGPLYLGRARVSGLSVTLHEGDSSFPKKEKPAAEEGKGFESDGILVSGASFTYRKDSPAGASTIRLHEISAEIGPFGSFGHWKGKEISAKAEATLENSGKVNLGVDARLEEEGPWVDVDLRLRGQSLKEMNRYFRKEEGVSLDGRLLESRGVVKVRNAQAEGHVVAKYEGLKVQFHANRHRGALSAIFTNLGVAVAVNKGNSGEPREDRQSAVVTRRHKKESVVGFILRTLKEAVLRVAS